MSRSGTLLMFCLLGLALSSCDRPGPLVPDAPSAGGPLTVYVVNYPLEYFCARIGGDLVQAEFPAPDDVDPAFWRPSPEIIAAYQKADLILLNGAGYAKWVAQATLPLSRLVDTSASFTERLIRIEETVTHQHGPEGEHSHRGIAFTTWLDPTLAAAQARACLDALVARLPDHEAVLQGRFDALEEELLALDARVLQIIAKDRSRPLLVSHPVYQYWTRHYELSVRSVHWEPDVMPEDGEWSQLETLLESHRARWMLWEGKPSSAVVERLREQGVNSAVFSPCGNTPDSGDFLSVMEASVAALERVFEG